MADRTDLRLDIGTGDLDLKVDTVRGDPEGEISNAFGARGPGAVPFNAPRRLTDGGGGFPDQRTGPGGPGIREFTGPTPGSLTQVGGGVPPTAPTAPTAPTKGGTPPRAPREFTGPTPGSLTQVGEAPAPTTPGSTPAPTTPGGGATPSPGPGSPGGGELRPGSGGGIIEPSSPSSPLSFASEVFVTAAPLATSVAFASEISAVAAPLAESVGFASEIAVSVPPISSPTISKSKIVSAGEYRPVSFASEARFRFNFGGDTAVKSDSKEGGDKDPGKENNVENRLKSPATAIAKYPNEVVAFGGGKSRPPSFNYAAGSGNNAIMGYEVFDNVLIKTDYDGRVAIEDPPVDPPDPDPAPVYLFDYSSASVIRASEAAFQDPRYGWSFAGSTAAENWKAANVARIFPDGAVFIEDERENRIPSSVDLAAWARQSLGAVVEDKVGPDLSLSGTEFSDWAGSRSYLSQSFIYSGNATMFTSVHMSATAGYGTSSFRYSVDDSDEAFTQSLDEVAIDFRTDDTTSDYINNSLVRTFGGSGSLELIPSGTITDARGHWLRHWFKHTTPTVSWHSPMAHHNHNIYLYPAGYASTAYRGDTTFYGAQMEVGSYPTSLIRTPSSGLGTRNEDIITLDSSDISPSFLTGAWMVEFYPRYNEPDQGYYAGSPRLFAWEQSGDDAGLSWYGDGDTFEIRMSNGNFYETQGTITPSAGEHFTVTVDFPNGLMIVSGSEGAYTTSSIGGGDDWSDLTGRQLAICHTSGTTTVFPMIISRPYLSGVLV